MSLKALAEGIILQSLEDLWDKQLRANSIDFFKGEEFHICADLAGMDFDGRLKLLTMVRNVVATWGGKSSQGIKCSLVERTAKKREAVFHH